MLTDFQNSSRTGIIVNFWQTDETKRYLHVQWYTEKLKVATHLRDGGIFYYGFTTNLLLILRKNFEYRSVFGKVRVENTVVPFSGHSVYARLC